MGKSRYLQKCGEIDINDDMKKRILIEDQVSTIVVRVHIKSSGRTMEVCKGASHAARRREG